MDKDNAKLIATSVNKLCDSNLKIVSEVKELNRQLKSLTDMLDRIKDQVKTVAQ